MQPVREDRHESTYQHPNGNPDQGLPFLRVNGKVLSTWAFDSEADRAQFRLRGKIWLYCFGPAFGAVANLAPSIIVGDEPEIVLVRTGYSATERANVYGIEEFTDELRAAIAEAGKIDVLIDHEPIPPITITTGRFG